MNEVCKYCYNFYSTLCFKCRVNTGNSNDADYSCGISEKKVQKNWKVYEKAKHKLIKIAGDCTRNGKEVDMHIEYDKGGTDGRIIDIIQGFLLPEVPEHPEHCQLCGKKLTESELRNPGEIHWRKDGKLMKVASAYYCFDCVQKITGKKIKEPEPQGDWVVRDKEPL